MRDRRACTENTTARRGAVALLFALTSGCRQNQLPNVRDTARTYEDAVLRGDAAAIYAMMSEDSRRAMRPADVATLLANTRTELIEQAKQASGRESAVATTATLELEGGEHAVLDWQGDRFLVGSAGGLPVEPRTPTQALEQLRKSLSRRSYAGLLRVLSPATRSAVESDLRALVEGLTHPEGLEVQISGDVASVTLDGGHVVRLRLERGVWKVEDFD